jgi:hypothetical protein
VTCSTKIRFRKTTTITDIYAALDLGQRTIRASACLSVQMVVYIPAARDVVAGSSNLSIRRTGIPNRFNSIAAVMPVGPAPTIKTGVVVVRCCCRERGFKKVSQDQLISRARSDLCYTAIHEQLDTSDITGVIRREQRDIFYDFVRIPSYLVGLCLHGRQCLLVGRGALVDGICAAPQSALLPYAWRMRSAYLNSSSMQQN